MKTLSNEITTVPALKDNIDKHITGLLDDVKQQNDPKITIDKIFIELEKTEGDSAKDLV